MKKNLFYYLFTVICSVTFKGGKTKCDKLSYST